MDTYSKRLLEFLRYVPYLEEEKERIQCFLNGFPRSYKDMIKFDEPKNLEDTIRKAKCCYYQSKNRQEPLKDWKRKDKTIFQNKGI
jgi:hypothetical protein